MYTPAVSWKGGWKRDLEEGRKVEVRVDRSKGTGGGGLGRERWVT